jgi:23S rRNA (adenine2503-C2)-methyltransferase
MTGKQGFTAHLTAAQILNQVLSIPESENLTNVVLMGMGEPFDNIGQVLQALTLMTADYGLAWSPKRITVSTVGVMKGLRRFLDESDCHLAISLHNPFPDERLQLMPAEKACSISDMLSLLRQYDFTHQRRLSFEYIVFRGVNDTEAHARELVRTLKGLECRINLIRFHAIPGVPLEGVEMDKMVAFRDYLTHHGVFTTIRASRGEDIWAACGMLSTMRKASPTGTP